MRQVTAEELVQLYETRRLIEGNATRQICLNTLPLLPQVEDSLLAMKRQSKDVDLFHHVELDHLFHRSIVASAGNTVTTELYDSLSSRQQRVAMAACTANPGRISKIIDEHQRIYDGLVAHDFEAVSETLGEHLRPVVEVTSRLGKGFAAT